MTSPDERFKMQILPSANELAKRINTSFKSKLFSVKNDPLIFLKIILLNLVFPYVMVII